MNVALEQRAAEMRARAAQRAQPPPPLPTDRVGRFKRLPGRVQWAMRNLAEQHSVDPLTVFGAYGSRQTTKCRGAVCRKLRAMGFSLHEIARWLDIDHSTVLHHAPSVTRTPTDGPVVINIPIPDLSGEWAI